MHTRVDHVRFVFSMLAFLFIDILLGFENAGIAPNRGVTEKNCHIIAHLRLGPQWLGGL